MTHLRLPVRDVDIPTSWQMRAILSAIRLALAEGETVYVHCWGGVGRTGTVVGCLLVEDGIPVGDVLDLLARLRRDTQRAHRTSPETHEQRTFIEHWSAQDTLVLDQQAIDRMAITAVPSYPSPVPTLGEIVATLGNGAPVVIEGPEPGWCVQAVAQDDGLSVQVEVLDPEHWESGPALPPEQQRTIEQLGFAREPSAWVRVEQDDDGITALRRSAELMLEVANQAWGVEAQGALRLEDVTTPDAPWEGISEFAHTFNGYAHFGEDWGERFSAVRDRYFQTGALPNDIDELRACLFCEFRMDRFAWGDDVTLSEPDGEGVRHIVNNPDFESSPTQQYRRAVIARIRELLTSRRSGTK